MEHQAVSAFREMPAFHRSISGMPRFAGRNVDPLARRFGAAIPFSVIPILSDSTVRSTETAGVYADPNQFHLCRVDQIKNPSKYFLYEASFNGGFLFLINKPAGCIQISEKSSNERFPAFSNLTFPARISTLDGTKQKRREGKSI